MTPLHPADPARPTLGIIAGSGSVPVTVAAAAQADGRPICVFAIVGEADKDIEAFDHHWVRWGEIGRLFDLMNRERVGEIVICGAVNRPDFTTIRVDFGAILSLPKILSLMVGGDDTVLKNVVRFFEDRGYGVLGAHQVAPELVGEAGDLTRARPDKDAESDIVKGAEASLMLGSLDIGQAVIAVGGRVVAVEGIEGTDELIARVADLRKRGRLKGAARSGVLVKRAKPQQDLRVDMPTIGPRTATAAIEAGLAGIVLEAGRVMIVDRPETVRIAEAGKLFIRAATFADQGRMG